MIGILLTMLIISYKMSYVTMGRMTIEQHGDWFKSSPNSDALSRGQWRLKNGLNGSLDIPDFLRS